MSRLDTSEPVSKWEFSYKVLPHEPPQLGILQYLTAIIGDKYASKQMSVLPK